MKVSRVLQDARAIAKRAFGFSALPSGRLYRIASDYLQDAIDDLRESRKGFDWSRLDHVHEAFDLAISMALSDEATR